MTVQRLFRRQIVGGAQHRFVVGGRQRRHAAVVVESSQPQIQDLDHAFLVEQQIGGLDIPMNESVLVRMGQTVGGLPDNLGGFDVIQPPAFLDRGLGVLTLDELHHQVVDFLVVLDLLADIVSSDDVRMVQRSDSLRFDVETFQHRRVLVDLGLGQNLDRTLPPHHLVLGQEDGSHAALAQRPQQPI